MITASKRSYQFCHSVVKVQHPYAVLSTKKTPMICFFGPFLGHLKKNQFCVFMVKIQQPCTIYQNKTMVDDLRH